MKKKQTTDQEQAIQPTPAPTDSDAAVPGVDPEVAARLAKAWEEAQPETVEITSLQQLLDRLEQPIYIDIDFQDGREILRLAGRRLKARVVNRIQEMWERHVPPMKVDAESGKEVLDFENPDYQKKVREDRRRGQALAIWTAFPVLRGDRPANLQPDEIADLLEEMLTNTILHEAWVTLSAGERVVGRTINFTSGDGSPLS